MRRILVLSVVLSLFLLGGAGPAHAETITIEADDNEFIPEEVTAQVGDTIVFENVGSAPHIATASDDSFDTGNLNPGDSAEVTLEEEGTIDYVCSYHVALGMEGTIIVEGAAGAPAGGEEEEAGEEEGGEEAGEEAEEDSDAAAADEGEDIGTAGEEDEQEAGGADEESAEEEEVVPTQKYFPPLGVGLFVLMLLGLAPAVKEFLIPAMTASKEDTEPEPVGAPPSLAVTASAPPAAALTAAPQAPAAPAAAPAAAPEAAPAAAPATSAVPATQAPTPGPTDPPLDPEKVFQAVMADETKKGTDPSVAEARAKAAKGRAEEALEMSKAPAEAPSAPAAVAPTAASEAPPEAAPPAPAAAPAPSGPTMSDEEAAEIRAKVKEEELAKGSDPRVAEGRAKAAELRAKKGTSGPK